ncbi:MAG: cysteine desulfurase [Verrucomicrobia bacterium]|nr:cysteine desulfurase [Verrucomicrobiota bacterium]
MRRIFLDHQSSTPVLPEVFEAMRPYFTEVFGSPSSLHQHGLQARDAVAKAREQVASFINAESPDNIVFTPSGTEAANLAVKGVAYANRRRGNHIVVSEAEHPAVLNSAEFLETQGFACHRVKVDGQGRVNPEDVRGALTDRTLLICVQLANHDIGTIQPIAEISAIAHERGIPLFVDAASSAGWLPIDVQALGIGLLSLAPHRFYGPKGVGVLYRSRGARVAGIIHGGMQEGGRQAGTENVPGIVGAGVACAVAAREKAGWIRHAAALQERLWTSLQARIPYLKLNGPELGPERIGTNLNVSFEFLEGEAILLRLDVLGIAVASGTSCVSKSLKISPVLAAIGLEHSLAQGSIIFSLGKDNTQEEIGHTIETCAAVAAKLREMSPRWEEFQRGGIDSMVCPRSTAPSALGLLSGSGDQVSEP